MTIYVIIYQVKKDTHIYWSDCGRLVMTASEKYSVMFNNGDWSGA